MAKKEKAKKETKQMGEGCGKVGIKEFIDLVAERIGNDMTKKDIEAVVRVAILDVMFDSLVKRREVGFTGLFSLVPKLRAARQGRNPQKPEETITIPEKWTVTLKMGKDLKEQINSRKK